MVTPKNFHEDCLQTINSPNDQTANQSLSWPENTFLITFIRDIALNEGSDLNFVSTWTHSGSVYPSITTMERLKVSSDDGVNISVIFVLETSGFSARIYVNNGFDKLKLNE